MSTQPSFTVYPVSNYSFGTKTAKADKDQNPHDRLSRLEEQYRRLGQRRTVDAILLVHEHNHPHVIMLQGAPNLFKLPGGRLRPGEDEVEGLRRKLDSHLAPTTQSVKMEWQIGECAGVWYRSHFDAFMYPYLAPHITRPREVKKIYVVPLSERQFFAVPKNFKLLAIPLFELYDNLHRYGPVLAAIPTMLSRYRFMFAAPQLLPQPPLQLQAQAANGHVADQQQWAMTRAS